jgi:hypothetical protein
MINQSEARDEKGSTLLDTESALYALVIRVTDPAVPSSRPRRSALFDCDLTDTHGGKVERLFAFNSTLRLSRGMISGNFLG